MPGTDASLYFLHLLIIIIISHLHNGEEEDAVAGALKGAPLRLGPLLAPAVLHLDMLSLPISPGNLVGDRISQGS